MKFIMKLIPALTGIVVIVILYVYGFTNGNEWISGTFKTEKLEGGGEHIHLSFSPIPLFVGLVVSLIVHRKLKEFNEDVPVYKPKKDQKPD